jgi:predicted ATP-binding protein involved in virulence
METDRYAGLLSGVKRLLDLESDDRIQVPPGGGIQISIASSRAKLPLDAWADGYRLTFLWLLDFYGRALRAEQIDADGTVHGIVLIDELDQHLHPSLQATVVQRLAELLPHAQIIATTHSPLVALGADPSQLVVLRHEGDEVISEDHVPDFRGYSAEDMLSDDRLFDSSVYSPETEGQLARYEELVSKGAADRSQVETRELADLVERMRAQPLPPDIDDRVVSALSKIDDNSKGS